MPEPEVKTCQHLKKEVRSQRASLKLESSNLPPGWGTTSFSVKQDRNLRHICIALGMTETGMGAETAISCPEPEAKKLGGIKGVEG